MNLNLHASQSGDAVLNALNLYFSKNPEGNFKLAHFKIFPGKVRSRKIWTVKPMTSQAKSILPKTFQKLGLRRHDFRRFWTLFWNEPFSKLLARQRLHLCSSFECRFWFYSFDEPEAVWAQSIYKKQYGETSLCYNKVQDACDNLNHVGYSSRDQFNIFHISKCYHLV